MTPDEFECNLAKYINHATKDVRRRYAKRLECDPECATEDLLAELALANATIKLLTQNESKMVEELIRLREQVQEIPRALRAKRLLAPLLNLSDKAFNAGKEQKLITTILKHRLTFLNDNSTSTKE